MLLNQVRLYWTDTGAKDFTLEVSNDNSIWTTVSTAAADTNLLDIVTTLQLDFSLPIFV